MRLLEQYDIVPGVLPYDAAGAAGNGDYVSLKLHPEVTVVFIKMAGDAGEDPTITLQQATAVAGTGVKALTFTDIYTKQGADLTAVGQWTRVTQTAASTYTSATGGETAEVWAIPIRASQLDVDNGFDCIRASVADLGSGSSVFGTLFYILGPCGYQQEILPSAIAD
jgi:hypothetical protein